MTRVLTFDPRLDAHGTWRHGDGARADPAAVGLAATIEGDGTIRIGLGDASCWYERTLTAGEALALMAFLSDRFLPTDGP